MDSGAFRGRLVPKNPDKTRGRDKSDVVSVYDMDEGMRYVCQRCGNCCRWPGEVPITEEETARIADFLGLDLYDFVARFTEVRRNRTGLTIREKENDECVFLDGIECKIQPVKPVHCAGFPNRWNFPGWRKVCEAIPVPLEASEGELPQK